MGIKTGGPRSVQTLHYTHLKNDGVEKTTTDIRKIPLK